MLDVGRGVWMFMLNMMEEGGRKMEVDLECFFTL